MTDGRNAPKKKRETIIVGEVGIKDKYAECKFKRAQVDYEFLLKSSLD